MCPTRDWTCNPLVDGWCSNQLSYSARSAFFLQLKVWSIRFYIFFNRVDKSLCLWQLCILNMHLCTLAPQKRGYFYYPYRKSGSSKRVTKQTLLIRDLGAWMCATWFLSLWSKSYGSKFFHSRGDTVIFPYCTPISWECAWSQMLNYTLDFWLLFWLHSIWLQHKCRLYHSTSLHTMIHKETSFTGSQQIKSLG